MKFLKEKSFLFIALFSGIIQAMNLDFKEINKISFATDNKLKAEKTNIINNIAVIASFMIDIDYRDNYDENTPLMWAAKNNDKNLLLELIKKGADIHFQNRNNETALIITIQNRNLEIAQILINNGADLNVKDKDNKTALYYAIKSYQDNRKKVYDTEDYKEIKDSEFLYIINLLINNKSNIHTKYENNKNILILAAQTSQDKPELIKLLIESKININYKDKGNNPALFYMIQNRKIESLKTLLTHKNIRLHFNQELMLNPRTYLPDRNSYTYEIGNKRFKNYEELNKEFEKTFNILINFANKIKKLLVDFAKKGNISDFKRYLLNIGTICIKDLEGNNLLHHAINSGNLELIKLIFWLKPELLNEPNKKNIIPGDLIQKNLSTITFFGNIVKHLAYNKVLDAIQKNDIQELQSLCDQNYDFNFKNQDGKTPLILAIEKENKNIIKILLSKNNPNIQDSNGNSPLHYAVNKQNIEIIKLLLKSGADISTLNSDAQSALDLAKSYGYDQIIEIIEEHKSQNNK